MVVTSSGQYFEGTVSQLQDGYVEGTAAQVLDQDFLLNVGLVNTESQGCCGRLIDDSFNFQSGNTTGILGCLSLSIIEISRYGNDGLGDRFAEISLSIGLHVLQDHRREQREIPCT